MDLPPVPVIARYRGRMKRRYFRADAAFANPDVYELLVDWPVQRIP